MSEKKWDQDTWDRFVSVQESLFEQGCDAGRNPVLMADAELTRLREACNDAIELAQEGWAYEGENGYFFKKWNVRERLADLRRRVGMER